MMGDKTKAMIARGLLFGIAIGFLAGCGQAQDPAAYDQRGALVDDRGNGCDYYLLEPEGWKATSEGAAEHGAHMLLRPLKGGAKKNAPFIKLQCPRMGDGELLFYLSGDLPNGEMFNSERIEVENPWYGVDGYHESSEGGLHEYHAVVSADNYTRFIYAVLATGKRPATEDELKAFRDLVASLCWDLDEVFPGQESSPWVPAR